jgi:hypothetical protein
MGRSRPMLSSCCCRNSIFCSTGACRGGGGGNTVEEFVMSNVSVTGAVRADGSYVHGDVCTFLELKVVKGIRPTFFASLRVTRCGAGLSSTDKTSRMCACMHGSRMGPPLNTWEGES